MLPVFDSLNNRHMNLNRHKLCRDYPPCLLHYVYVCIKHHDHHCHRDCGLFLSYRDTLDTICKGYSKEIDPIAISLKWHFLRNGCHSVIQTLEILILTKGLFFYTEHFSVSRFLLPNKGNCKRLVYSLLEKQLNKIRAGSISSKISHNYKAYIRVQFFFTDNLTMNGMTGNDGSDKHFISTRSQIFMLKMTRKVYQMDISIEP